MQRGDVEEGLKAVVSTHGPWGSHNVQLPYGIFTIGPEPRGDNFRTAKFLQLATDLLRRPFSELRVLDLGCGEGLYALEFGQFGAQVVGIEGREANLAKAEFARRALGLGNVTFELGDVRAVSRDTHGAFDLVICSGLLYHLDHPELFDFLKIIRGICTGACIIDTWVAEQADRRVEYDGLEYWGSVYREHPSDTSPDERIKQTGASLDNETSFWVTKYDLTNFLMEIGFSSVVECLAPVPYMLRTGRITLVASSGAPVRPHNEIGFRLADRRWPAHWGISKDHPAATPAPAPERSEGQASV